METGMGVHLLLNLVGCEERFLSEKEEVEKLVQGIIEESSLTKLQGGFHQFNPSGVTGFVLLAESHFSIHTWPEHKSIAVDIFCCYLEQGHKKKAIKKAEEAGQLLIDKVGPEKVKRKLVMR